MFLVLTKRLLVLGYQLGILFTLRFKRVQFASALRQLPCQTSKLLCVALRLQCKSGYTLFVACNNSFLDRYQFLSLLCPAREFRQSRQTHIQLAYLPCQIVCLFVHDKGTGRQPVTVGGHLLLAFGYPCLLPAYFVVAFLQTLLICGNILRVTGYTLFKIRYFCPAVHQRSLTDSHLCFPVRNQPQALVPLLIAFPQGVLQL